MARKKTLPLIEDFNNIPEEALVPAAEQPYPIPDHWKWVRLGGVSTFLGGGTPDKSIPSYWHGQIPWASVKDLRSPIISTTLDTISHLGLQNSSTQLCQIGDLILATRITPGKTAIAASQLAINQDLKIVRSQLLLPNFLQMYFRSQLRWFEENSSGSTVMGIRITALNNLPTPLPPLDEQQQIVEKLSGRLQKVDETIQLLEQHLLELPSQRNQIIQAGVDGLLTQRWRERNGAAKDSWTQAYIGDLGTIATGTTPPTKNPHNYGDYLPFIKPADLSQGRHTRSSESFLSEAGARIARVIPAGSVAMCCIGTIAKAGLIEVDAATNQQINTLTPVADHNAVFLFYLFESPEFKKQVTEASSATTIPIINKGRFSKLKVKLPTHAEQCEIGATLDKILNQIDTSTEFTQKVVNKLTSVREEIIRRALMGITENQNSNSRNF